MIFKVCLLDAPREDGRAQEVVPVLEEANHVLARERLVAGELPAGLYFEIELQLLFFNYNYGCAALAGTLHREARSLRAKRRLGLGQGLKLKYGVCVRRLRVEPRPWLRVRMRRERASQLRVFSFSGSLEDGLYDEAVGIQSHLVKLGLGGESACEKVKTLWNIQILQRKSFSNKSS